MAARGAGARQLRALLVRQCRLKRRRWVPFVTEVLAPTALLCLLVVGKSLSEWAEGAEQVYANRLPLNTSEGWYRDAQRLAGEEAAEVCAEAVANATEYVVTSNATGYLPGEDWRDGFQRDVLAYSLETFGLRSTLELELALAQALREPTVGGAAERLLEEAQRQQREEGTDLTLGALNLTGDEPLNQTVAETALADALSYFGEHGPLPVLSLDEFVLLSQATNLTLDLYPWARRVYTTASQLGFNTLGNLISLGKLGFAPDVPLVRDVVARLNASHALFDRHFGGVFATEGDALDALNSRKGVWAVIVFDAYADPASASYRIRMRFTKVPESHHLVSKWRSPGLYTPYFLYWSSGFLTVQRSLNLALESIATGHVGWRYERYMVWGVPFPEPGYKYSLYYDSLGPMMGLLICLSCLYPLGMLLKGLVEEKETRARETMAVMGLRRWALAAAWSLTYLLVFALVAVLTSSFLQPSIFPKSDYMLVLGLFGSFMLTCIPLAFLLSSFFSRARLASIVGPFALFALVMPRYVFFRANDTQAVTGKRLACLLAPTAFTFGADLLAKYEGAQRGLTWDVAYSEDDGLPVGDVLGMLLFDTFLYAALSWYLGEVLPSEYGTPKPWWFLFSSAYWRAGPADAAPQKQLRDAPPADAGGCEDGLVEAVRVDGLTKTYANGVKAVSDLSFTMYEGEIFSLLGANGAGKSTTAAMLTGMTAPTQGDARLYGLSLSTQMDSVRRGLLGFCPQVNTHFEYLSAGEHLELYAVLKGVPESDVEEAVTDKLKEVGLTEKRDALAGELSGGMKRRLQLAMALIGGSRVILCDEPTSGLDPLSRRAVWSLLKSARPGRCIVLTTHFLDEADILSDRIAILQNGRLACCDRTDALKRDVGGGYVLAVSAQSKQGAADLGALVREHVPSAETHRVAGGESAFKLPLDASPAFAALFAALDASRNALGVRGYTVGLTTLEEVFLTVVSRVDEEDERRAARARDAIVVGCLGGVPAAGCLSPSEARSAAYIEMQENVGQARVGAAQADAGDVALELEPADDEESQAPVRRVRRQGGAAKKLLRDVGQMVRKRRLISARDRKGGCTQVFVPILTVALVLMIMYLDVDPSGPSRALDLCDFPGSPTRVPTSGKPDELSFSSCMRMKEVREDNPPDSIELSYMLLEDPDDVAFGAYVFNDTILPHVDLSECVRGAANATEEDAGLEEAALAGSTAERFMRDAGYGERDVSNAGWAAERGYRALESYSLIPVMLLHNTTSAHSWPAFLSELHSSLLRSATGRPDATIGAASHPLPLTPSESTALDAFLMTLSALMIMIPFQYLAATYGAFVVKERVSKSKLQQLASGCTVLAYWLGSLIWEFVSHSAVCICTWVLLFAIGNDSLIGDTRKAFACLLLLLVYGLASIPLSFLLSEGFRSHAGCIISLSLFYFVTGFCALNSYIVLSTSGDAAAEVAERNIRFYRLSPAFLLGEGLLWLATSEFNFDFNAPEDEDGTWLDVLQSVGSKDPFEWDIVGRPLVLLSLEAVGYFALVVAREHAGHLWRRWLTRRAQASDEQPLRAIEEEDVAAEAERVGSTPFDADAVRIHELTKVYGRQLGRRAAVDGLSLGIPKGEKFGLLGVNGAGKTTTVSVLCGDVPLTGGTVHVLGRDVTSDLEGVRERLGFCPQADPLLDLMTGRETLEMYARLRGTPEPDVAGEAESMLQRTGLSRFADRPAGTYSGGNKRKLSLGIALVGGPTVVVLDEPSSGMDALARRQMWAAIERCTGGAAVILLSHSMEEVEAICERVGIMHDGRLQCLGSPPHLKAKYGAGFFADLTAGAGRADALAAFMLERLPQAVLLERHATRLKYRVAAEIGDAFAAIEAARAEGHLEDYSISAASLEHVFASVCGEDADPSGSSQPRIAS